MLYIDMFGAKLVCRMLCKCYASFIITYNGCWYFLHISHIRQKLPKPNRFLNTMASSHILRVRCRYYNGLLFIAFSHNDNKKDTYQVVDCWSFESPAQSPSQKLSKQ